MANQTTERATNLRQAKAKAYTSGLLSEMVLEEKKNDEGKECIEGYLTIKTNEVNFIRYKASAFKLTKDGRENSVYKGLVTCKDEYKTIGEVGEDKATQLIVSGEINPYTGQNGDVIGFKSNFFNRAKKQLSEDEFKSEFEIETYIRSIAPEVNNEGEETGRVIINGWIPTYNGIEPIALVAGAEDGVAEAIVNTYEIGQTVLFTGEIINNRVEHIKEIPMAIGKPKIEKTYSYKNDMLITGASEPYGEEKEGDLEAAYNSDAIRLAIQVREEKLEERKNKNSNTSNSSQKPSGNSRGRTLGF